MNTARLGEGVAVVRHTGRNGKKGNHAASASFMTKITSVFSESGIPWQCGELGAVDAGGGSTVSKCIADWGTEVLDIGPALLSMHSPLEIASKTDAYWLYRGIRAFFEDGGPHICHSILY